MALRNKNNNGRLIIMLAIIFLLGGVLIFRLFDLQVLKYDLFMALASDQHQVFSKLEPERGKIYFQDQNEKGEKKLYAIATNKDFPLIYAVPKKIENPEKTAEELYNILDKERIVKEVEKMLSEDEYFKDFVENEQLSAEEWKKKQEFWEIKKELEIKIKQEKIVKKYLEKLSKKGDPYEPIKRKASIDEKEKIMALNIDGLDYIMEKHRFYPEAKIGAHMIGFVGSNGEEQRGQYGLEGFFNDELSGKRGSIKTEKAAGGNLIIINDREYSKPINGSDLVLTINHSIQYEICAKLSKAVEEYDADSGSIIVTNPFTGEILAMCSWPDYDSNNYNEIDDINIYNNPAIFNAYEPGSIFKVFTVSAGIDQGKISPDTLYNDTGMIKIAGWPKPIKNSDFETHGPYGTVDMITVLEKSLNTGSIFIMEKTGAEIFSRYVQNFGFGEKTGIELETEGFSNIINLKRKTIRPVEAATASFGQGITATPLQIVAAFSAIVNGGILMKPYIVSEIINSDGISDKTSPKAIRRVISEKTALLVSGMMVNVVDGGHAKYAAVNGYYVGGKTGTAQVADRKNGGYKKDETIHTFIGFAPAEDPKFVMLIKLDNPKNVKFAASSAAPLFGEIAKFILNYLKVPKER